MKTNLTEILNSFDFPSILSFFKQNTQVSGSVNLTQNNKNKIAKIRVNDTKSKPNFRSPLSKIAPKEKNKSCNSIDLDDIEDLLSTNENVEQKPKKRKKVNKPLKGQMLFDCKKSDNGEKSSVSLINQVDLDCLDVSLDDLTLKKVEDEHEIDFDGKDEEFIFDEMKMLAHACPKSDKTKGKQKMNWYQARKFKKKK